MPKTNRRTIQVEDDTRVWLVAYDRRSGLVTYHRERDAARAQVAAANAERDAPGTSETAQAIIAERALAQAEADAAAAAARVADLKRKAGKA